MSASHTFTVPVFSIYVGICVCHAHVQFDSKAQQITITLTEYVLLIACHSLFP